MEKVAEVVGAHPRGLPMPIVWVLRGAVWEMELVTERKWDVPHAGDGWTRWAAEGMEVKPAEDTVLTLSPVWLGSVVGEIELVGDGNVIHVEFPMGERARRRNWESVVCQIGCESEPWIQTL